MIASSTAWLGTSLPPLAATQVYKLLEAGALKLSFNQKEPCTVQGRFQVCDEATANSPTTPVNMVECPINLYRAALLLPGTCWSAAGHLVSKPPSLTPAETRTVVLGERPLLSRQLHRLFPTPDRPALLAPYGLRGWYLLVETPAEHVLLPCFEVARAFYYASGQHLISYCLSRLALDRVCWPLASPDTTLHQTAHFCVAAPSLRHSEIRLFAELLFNPHCRQTIQRVHTRLAQCWARGRHQTDVPAPWLRLDWQLGRDVRVQACGESFYWRGKAYFLVHSLTSAADWFCYRAVVCHLLGQSANHRPAPLFPPIAPVLPVAALLFPASPLALREQQAVEATTTRPVPLLGQGAAPPVTLGECWALSSPGFALAACYPTADSIRPYLWEHCRHYLAPSCDDPPASLAAQLPGLARILAHLAPHLQTVEPIELSNPGQLHGRGVSVFPPGSLPSHRTHLPSRCLRPVGVLHLRQGGAHFYLFHLAEDQPLVLVYELRLGVLSTAELQEVLYQFSYAGYIGEQVGRALFTLTNQVHMLCLCPHQQAAAIGDWCLAQIRWGICRYNAYRYLLREPDQVATRFEQLGRQLEIFRRAGRYLERGYLHFPGQQVAELPDAAQF